MRRIVFIFIGLIALAALVGGIYLGVQNLRKSEETLNQKRAEEESQAQKIKERHEKQKVLLETVAEIWKANSPGTSYSIGIQDLKNDEYFSYNDEKAQHAASVSKVLTAIVLLDKVDKGSLSLADPLGAYNVEFQLEKMVNISNEPSWDLIDNLLKISPQNQYAKRIGLTSVNLVKNVMSVKDTTTLLKKLYKGELLSEASRERLYGYMQNTESEDYFSPAFKKFDVPFYHKTGKYKGEGHDAAIVELENSPFILVVFSNNNTNPGLISRGLVMNKTAEVVLEFFQEQQ